MTPIRLELPWPPSVNTYWRSLHLKGRVRVIISRDGNHYIERVRWICVEQRLHNRMLVSRLAVLIEAYPPDARVRDIDNLPKGLLDSLTKARVWSDDGLIDDLRIVRKPVIKGGKIVITINEAGKAITDGNHRVTPGLIERYMGVRLLAAEDGILPPLARAHLGAKS